MRIGVDTGGTFTDCVILEDSQAKILKVFSTPDDAAHAILDGVRETNPDRWTKRCLRNGVILHRPISYLFCIRR